MANDNFDNLGREQNKEVQDGEGARGVSCRAACRCEK